MLSRLLVLVTLLALAAPAFGERADLEAAKDGIRDADLALARAVADRSLERFLAIVSDEAVFFGRETSRGKEAVAKSWGPLFTDPALSLKWRPTQVEVSSSGDLGYSIGSYERSGPDPKGKIVTTTGTYVSIWRKQADGGWKIVVDIGTPPTPREKP